METSHGHDAFVKGEKPQYTVGWLRLSRKPFSGNTATKDTKSNGFENTQHVQHASDLSFEDKLKALQNKFNN